MRGSNSEFDVMDWLNKNQIESAAIISLMTISWDIFALNALLKNDLEKTFMGMVGNSFRIGWEAHKQYGSSNSIHDNERG